MDPAYNSEPLSNVVMFKNGKSKLEEKRDQLKFTKQLKLEEKNI
jgi:hypothetical protein